MNPNMLAALVICGGALSYVLVGVVVSALAHRFNWWDKDSRDIAPWVWPACVVYHLANLTLTIILYRVVRVLAWPFKSLHRFIRTAGTGPKIPKAQVRQ